MEIVNKYEISKNLINNLILKYGENAIALSFNGGKESTVLLHLLYQQQNLHKICDRRFKKVLDGNTLLTDKQNSSRLTFFNKFIPLTPVKKFNLGATNAIKPNMQSDCKFGLIAL